MTPQPSRTTQIRMPTNGEGWKPFCPVGKCWRLAQGGLPGKHLIGVESALKCSLLGTDALPLGHETKKLGDALALFILGKNPTGKWEERWWGTGRCCNGKNQIQLAQFHWILSLQFLGNVAGLAFWHAKAVGLLTKPHNAWWLKGQRRWGRGHRQIGELEAVLYWGFETGKN